MDYQEIEKQQIHRLQIYCEQHVKLGDIVADRFNAEWMDDCWEYIKEQVQKDCESGKGAQIWHTAIYRLCRDYFNDNLHEVREKEKAEKEAKEKERIANVKAQNKAAKAKAEKKAREIEPKVNKAKKTTPTTKELVDKFAEKYHLDKHDAEIVAKNPKIENELLLNSPVNPDDPKGANDQRIATDAYNHAQVKAFDPEPGQLDFLALMGV